MCCNPWDFPDKNTGVGCHFLLQGIFLTQGSNLRLLDWQMDPLPLSHQFTNEKAIHLPMKGKPIHPFQFSSVAQLCLTLCDPIDCSMPGFPVNHQLLELTQTPKYWSFSFNISPSNEYSGLIFFRMDWFDLLAVNFCYKAHNVGYHTESTS